ncbi:MAG: nucleoside deaminase [Chloroflexi bacterium]|nr:MAG: nucleoside deaminase [Chloroflexota bacterium]
MVSAAQAALDSLELPWRSAFGCAWQSAQNGSVPVGAVVTSADGTVIASGRARSMETSGPVGVLFNTTIAHAEINTIAALPPKGYPDHTIWVTLEPCLQCIGAIVVARIGTVRFAGSDPLWKSIERLPDINPFVASRWPERVGPRDDQFGVLGQLLPLVFYRRRYPEGASITIHRQQAPAVAALADELVSSGEFERLLDRELPEVIAALWSRLSRSLT